MSNIIELEVSPTRQRKGGVVERMSFGCWKDDTQLDLVKAANN